MKDAPFPHGTSAPTGASTAVLTGTSTGLSSGYSFGASTGPPGKSGIETIRFRLNGRPVDLAVEPDRLLLWVLRSDLGLTGTKYGCGQAHCGSCTVLVDGKATLSCLTPMRSLEGTEVTTIEGLARDGQLHPIQEAFVTHDALQCGYCTPGMILGAYGLLMENPDPSKEEIVQGMEGHLCRCGGYGRIVLAIRDAAETMKGGVP
jgi:aerobic-type carbon monoxide dehydrogenase small subunit (CoxS/CutS family)